MIRKEHDAFHHGLIEVAVAGLRIFITHLNPTSGEMRVNEAKKILSFIDSSVNHRYILLGDLNSLSVKDKSSYEKEDLERIFNKESHFKKKYIHDGKFDFRTTEALSSELVDLGYLFDHPKKHVLNKHYDNPDHWDKYNISYSVPTKFQPDFSKFPFFIFFFFKIYKTPKTVNQYFLRIDYIMGSKNIVPFVKSCRIIRSLDTEWLSDHFPMTCTFKSHLLTYSES